jgi:hypothetical protein
MMRRFAFFLFGRVAGHHRMMRKNPDVTGSEPTSSYRVIQSPVFSCLRVCDIRRGGVSQRQQRRFSVYSFSLYLSSICNAVDREF